MPIVTFAQTVAVSGTEEASLRSSLRERWEANGRKTAGTWTEVVTSIANCTHSQFSMGAI
ncbi:MAG: hypothetical protein LBR97_08710 [Dysgonamonadaceae bacterium]|nr:hypothetical protein [Dysgonamonadaceae bacterium]